MMGIMALLGEPHGSRQGFEVQKIDFTVLSINGPGYYGPIPNPIPHTFTLSVLSAKPLLSAVLTLQLNIAGS